MNNKIWNQKASPMEDLRKIATINHSNPPHPPFLVSKLVWEYLELDNYAFAPFAELTKKENHYEVQSK